VLLKTDAPATDIPFTDYVTLRHHGFRDFGGETYRVLSRVPGARWRALRLERDRLSANFQGHPLWPHKALARYPKLSASLGLAGAYSKDVCLLPDMDTANGFLRVLGLGHFQFRGAQPASDRAYVDAFIDRRVLPMADVLGRDSIHDWSYHFLTFLFPEYLESVRANLEWIRAHLHRFEGKVTRAWVHYGHGRDESGRMTIDAREERTAWEEAIYRQMAVSLDVCTAKIVQILCVDESGQIERCRSELNIVSVFSAGVTDESLAVLLWLEPRLKETLSAPRRGRPLYPEDTMNYLRAKLAELENLCAMDPRAEERRRFFAKNLAGYARRCKKGSETF
jgi:hypothetical protein